MIFQMNIFVWQMMNSENVCDGSSSYYFNKIKRNHNWQIVLLK